MSALPPKADIRPRDQDVCFVPKADITALQRRMSLFDHLVGEDLPIAFSLDDSFRKADQGERETEVECLRCSPVDY